jgi:hypothetical protein
LSFHHFFHGTGRWRYKKYNEKLREETEARKKGRAKMDLVQMTWLNTLVLIIAAMLAGVILYGMLYEIRRTAEALARIEETAERIALMVQRQT